MSLKNKELIEKNQYELTFEVERSVFDAAVEKVYRRQAKNITIPGFRRGKAPRSIIEKMYGKGVFYEDAVNEVLPEAYEAAAKESGLDIVGRPEFDMEPIEDGNITLKAKVYIKPEVKIEGYKGIAAERTVEPVTDEEVNAEIDRVRARNSRMIDINDRPAQNGDTANIDFDGYVDGKQFDGGKGTGYDLVLGSGSFIPGYEEQVVGHAIGDEFDVNVPFPADYHEKPELDDEFVRDVSEFDTVTEYTADIKAKLEKAKTAQADSAVDEQLTAALIEKLDADIPPVMFDAETENLVRDYDTRLRMQGLDLATYLKYTGMTLDSIREQMKPQAERQVKLRLALEEIAKLENIEVSDEEIDAEYNRIAESYKVDVENVKSQIASEDLAKDLKVQKAIDLVKENAVITDKAAEAKKPAKKAPAKKSAKKAEGDEAAEDGAAKKAPAKKTTAKKTESADDAAPAKKAPAKKSTKKADDKAE